MTLKSLNFSLLVLTVESDDLSLLADELNKKRLMAPDFFQHAGVVVDIKNEQPNLDVVAIKNIIAEHEFILAGMSGELSESQKRDLQADNIAILRSAKKHAAKTVTAEPVEVKQPVQENKVVAPKKTKIIKGRVRSGQEVHAQDCDLVIIGDVSPGSVVIADGDIHIYGALRGRAIAGGTGNTDVSIFCRFFAPELVSIGGVYTLNDDVPAQYSAKSCLVSVIDEKMTFESLD